MSVWEILCYLYPSGLSKTIMFKSDYDILQIRTQHFDWMIAMIPDTLFIVIWRLFMMCTTADPALCKIIWKSLDVKIWPRLNWRPAQYFHDNVLTWAVEGSKNHNVVDWANIMSWLTNWHLFVLSSLSSNICLLTIGYHNDQVYIQYLKKYSH